MIDLVQLVNPTRAGLEAWLERQPAARRYNWNLAHQCLVALYVREGCGIAEPMNFFSGGYEELIGPDYYRIAQREPWTCGAALRRMRALPASGRE